ncbi:LOW QUALITY PROTEIN: fibronectin type III domain-containing protein 4 [Pelodytes ibericus]
MICAASVTLRSKAEKMAYIPMYLNPAVLVLFSCDLCLVRGNRPPSPVNVTVTQLKANSATVSWDLPEGDVIIGYAISQQRQDGQIHRFIREVNTTNQACVLWDLDEDTDYIIQVQSIGLYSESQASKRIHFRTLKETDRLPSNSSNQGDITVQGVDKERQLETGEIIIIVAVLLMWAAVIALFCRQYDIIKDNDSNNNKEKAKASSEQSTPERQTGGLLRKVRLHPRTLNLHLGQLWSRECGYKKEGAWGHCKRPPASKTLGRLLNLPEDHFQPKPLELAESHRFYQRQQQSGEDIQAYVAPKLASTCSFGEGGQLQPTAHSHPNPNQPAPRVVIQTITPKHLALKTKPVCGEMGHLRRVCRRRIVQEKQPQKTYRVEKPTVSSESDNDEPLHRLTSPALVKPCNDSTSNHGRKGITDGCGYHM